MCENEIIGREKHTWTNVTRDGGGGSKRSPEETQRAGGRPVSW
jgi:hypothetical protein